jgi:hypothetical protein
MLRVMPEGVELSEVLALNARRLRGAATLGDVAKAARRYGTSWTPGKVSDLEHGRVSPTLPTLVIVALSLSDVCGRLVTIAELVKSDENICLAKGFDVPSEVLKLLLDGDEKAYKLLLNRALDRTVAGAKAAVDSWPARLKEKVSVGLLRQVYADYGEPEQLLEREFGTDRDRLVAAMAALWKKCFHAERDRLAGPGANAQKKGRVARQLKADLKAVLDGDD